MAEPNISPVVPNQVFGALTVLAQIPKEPGKRHRNTMFLCRCVCGREMAVRRGRLPRAKSCGCLNPTRTHGMFGTPEYAAWGRMIQRCETPQNASYSYYGGRGITVCARWRESFGAFLEDMGPRPSPKHSLDRIDNARGYEPSNCRWATRLEQNRNTRRNTRITALGRTMTLPEWAESSGVDYSVLRARISSGWEPERAVTQPVGPPGFVRGTHPSVRWSRGTRRARP